MKRTNINQKQAYVRLTRQNNYRASLKLEGIVPPAPRPNIGDKERAKEELIAKYQNAVA